MTMSNENERHLEAGAEVDPKPEGTQEQRGWLKNGNRPGDPHSAPRCEAKTRRGSACQAPAMQNGRCRLQGGLSTGPKTAEGIDHIRKALTKHGRYSAATKLRTERYRQVRLGPYFEGKFELLESLREPTSVENSPTHRPNGSSVNAQRSATESMRSWRGLMFHA